MQQRFNNATTHFFGCAVAQPTSSFGTRPAHRDWVAHSPASLLTYHGVTEQLGTNVSHNESNRRFPGLAAVGKLFTKFGQLSVGGKGEETRWAACTGSELGIYNTSSTKVAGFPLDHTSHCFCQIIANVPDKGDASLHAKKRGHPGQDFSRDNQQTYSEILAKIQSRRSA